jgi:hypothetical protein
MDQLSNAYPTPPTTTKTKPFSQTSSQHEHRFTPRENDLLFPPPYTPIKPSSFKLAVHYLSAFTSTSTLTPKVPVYLPQSISNIQPTSPIPRTNRITCELQYCRGQLIHPKHYQVSFQHSTGYICVLGLYSAVHYVYHHQWHSLVPAPPSPSAISAPRITPLHHTLPTSPFPPKSSPPSNIHLHQTCLCH